MVIQQEGDGVEMDTHDDLLNCNADMCSLCGNDVSDMCSKDGHDTCGDGSFFEQENSKPKDYIEIGVDAEEYY